MSWLFIGHGNLVRTTIFLNNVRGHDARRVHRKLTFSTLHLKRVCNPQRAAAVIYDGHDILVLARPRCLLNPSTKSRVWKNLVKVKFAVATCEISPFFLSSSEVWKRGEV